MLARLAALLAGPVLACAQEIRPDPPVHLRIATVGPAGWRARLGPTNLGAMLASSEGEASWRPLADRIDAHLRHVRGDAAAFARERELLLDYGGDVHAVAWLEQAEDALHVARWSAAVVLEPDGVTDLAALGDRLHGWLVRGRERGSLPWRETEVMPPWLHGGRLVAVLANPEDREAAIARAKALRPEPLPRGGGVLRLEIDLQQLLRLTRDHPRHRGAGAAWVGTGTRTFAVTIDAAGPQIAVDASFAFGAGDRGFLGPLCPVRAGVPALEALAVPDAVFRLATRVDFAGLWRARESWLAAFHDLDVAELHARMTRANGLAVAEDLLVHLGDETLLVWLETERDARPDILPGLPCGLVRVREEVPFRGAVKKLARRDPRSSILADDEDRLVATFDDFCIGVGGGYACLAYGADAAEEVEDLVSLANAVKPVGAARPAPVPHAPPGLCGRGAIEIADVAATYSLPLAGMLQFLFGPGLPLPIAADVQREVERRMPLLRSHGLTAATILVGAQPSEWRLRILW